MGPMGGAHGPARARPPYAWANGAPPMAFIYILFIQIATQNFYFLKKLKLKKKFVEIIIDVVFHVHVIL